MDCTDSMESISLNGIFVDDVPGYFKVNFFRTIQNEATFY